MKTMKHTLLGAAVSAMVLVAAPVPAAESLVFTDLGGTVHLQQEVPCDDVVDLDVPIQSGRMDITPAILRTGVVFDLTRLDMFLTPFSVEHDCLGIHAVAEFREIGLKLANTVHFMGEETGEPESQLFRFRIPKEEFLIFESILDNAPVPQPETAYKRPSEDVTGLIDLRPRHHSVQLHIVLNSKLLFRAGCVGSHCLINERGEGTQNADVRAVLIPETTPPTVSCTAFHPPGTSFQVHAEDESGTPTIMLGSFVLANNEVFQLEQTGQPGVKLLETTRTGDLRHFQVGRGDNFVTATDALGNVAIAYCK